MQPTAFSAEAIEGLRCVFSCIDNTTLEGSDTRERIQSLCQQSIQLQDLSQGISHVAAVCVYPVFVKQARQLLQGSGIRVASVAGAFPSGQSPLSVKLRQEVGTQTLKVILETGELKTPQNIAKASQLAIDAGADFIKTSTGKISVSATLEASEVMLKIIKNHYDSTGKWVGFKAAGGISSPEEVLKYYFLTSQILGKKYVTNQFFRIGASRLTERLFAFLTDENFVI